MQVKAVAKFVRISPKKARPLARALRGKKSVAALDALRFDVSKTARLVYKLIFSAVSNAKNNYNLKEDNLRIKELTVDEGPTFKRYWYRSHGSADRLMKRSSHFSVILEEIQPSLVKKPVAKPTVASKEEPVVESSVDSQNSANPAQPPKDRNAGPKAQQGVKKVITNRTTNK